MEQRKLINKKYFIGCAVIFSFLTVLSASELATTDSGKRVILKDDGTWKYSTETVALKNYTYTDENITLTIRSAGVIQTYTDNKTAGLQFKIKNNSDRSIINLDVTVYFYDKKNKIFQEQKFYPVFAKTRYSFSSHCTELKPNYTILYPEDKTKYWIPKGIDLTEWQTGKISVKFSDIRYKKIISTPTGK